MIYLPTIKALTLWEPWASFVAVRAKCLETRGWATKYRGPLAIHASAKPPTLAQLRAPGIEAALRRHYILPDEMPLERAAEVLPLGKMLCVCDLVDCFPVSHAIQRKNFLQSEEFLLGNYEPGRFAWDLEMRSIFEPFLPAKGAQGIWLFTFPDPSQPQEARVAKTKTTKTKKPAGVLTEAEEAALAAEAHQEAALRPRAEKKQAAKPGADEFLQTYQKRVFREFSEAEYALRAKDFGRLSQEVALLEVQAKDDAAEWKSKIGGVDAQIRQLAEQINKGGEEREVTCRRRILEDRQVVQTFDAETLEIYEERPLSRTELQTEINLRDTAKAAANAAAPKPRGAKMVEGKFPADQKVGAHAVGNPAQDRKNDEAVKALAGGKD